MNSTVPIPALAVRPADCWRRDLPADSQTADTRQRRAEGVPLDLGGAPVAEPIDTIRRVNSGEPMTLEELYQARATLDRYIQRGQTDVQQARRRVGTMIAELEPAAPAASMPVGPRVTIPEPLPTEPRPPAKKQSNTAGVIGLLIIVVIIGAIFYSCSKSGGSGGSDNDGRNDGLAKVMCEKFVKDRLKAPATADFSGVFDTEVSGSGDDYTVRGYVDAENSFGANLRNNYVCQVHDDGNDNWTLVSLTGLN
jgi:hypothetical protein